MTNFTKNNIIVDGGAGEVWVNYASEDNKRVFVARFKHGAPKANANHFVKFLIGNITVEEYFAAYKSGKAPLEILEDKGYVGYNMVKALKQMGYAPDAAGKAQWRADRFAEFEKRKTEATV